MSIPLPTRPPTSAEVEAARRSLELIYQAPSATSVAGSAAARQAGGVLIRGASVALLTVGIWAAMEEPAGLPVLQEQLILHGPRGFFDQMERMLAEKGGDTQAVRALRTTVMGMLDNGQVHSAGLILGETLAEAQRGGLISRSANPSDLGFDAALRYAQQYPPRATSQAPPAQAPLPSPVAGSYATVSQPPALSNELQALRDRINSGQYADGNDAFNRGVGAFNGLVEQVNAQRRRGVDTVDNHALQVVQDELSGRRMTSVLSQFLRNASDGGPLLSSADMDSYMSQVRGLNAATNQRYGRPMFDPAVIDRIDQRLDAAIGFREDFDRFIDRASSGRYANSERDYSDGLAQLEAFRIRSNEIGAQHGVRGMTREGYQESLFQLEGRRIDSVMAYVGRELVAGNPIDPQITASLVDRAENLNARRRSAGSGDIFDARVMDGYRDTNAVADYRQDYRQFNAQVMGGAFANSQDAYLQGHQQLAALVERGNAILRDQGVQPLPQRTLQETEFQLEGRRIESQLSHLQREANAGRNIDPETTRNLVQAADQLNQNRRSSGGGDLFEARTMQEYRTLLQTVEQSAAPTTTEPRSPQPPQTSPPTQPNPQPDATPKPEQPPAQQPAPPQRDIEREWGEQFGHGDLADQLRREAERQGVSQEDVIDHARRNPSRTANEILSDVRDGNLSHGGTPPGNRPPGSNVAAPGQPDDTPPLDNLTIVRPLPPASQPEDPLLPFHAVPRTERMQPPDPVVVNGRSYDVLGMTANGELQLRPPTDNVRTVPDNAMFVQTPTTPADLRPGAEVVYSGRTWRVGEPVEAGRLPGVTERSHRLVDPHNDSATALVPESRANEIFKRVGREVTYNDRQWEFGAATGRGYVLIDPANRDNTVTVPLNQADQIRMRFAGGTEYTLQGLQNGVLRVAPSEPSGDLSYRPLPGETFEARLKNRELEGVYNIRVGENGELTATGRNRNGTEVSERIQPSDIAPRYVGVDSPEFKQRFQVDAFLHREAETRARAIATEPTGLPVRDPNLGAMPETVRPQVLLGVRGLDAQADFIRRYAAEVTPGTEPRLTVFNMGFSNQGEAQRVVDAMVDFRRAHPDARIEVVAERTRFESASRSEGYGQFLQTLRDNGVQLNFFENGDTSRQVIHAKGVIVNDHVLFTTGAVIDASKNKVDIATELPPDAARSFIRFFDQGINGNADPATRQQLLADMSRQGVLVDDPVTRTPYISRTQDALINGAENRLFISLSDLTNPDTTRTIIDRVRNGVNVEIQYREMDPTSRQLLDRAMQQYPDRLRVENISNWDPRPHYNVIVADDKQAYVGTSYLWPNQQQQIHHTRSFENGVLLQGESVRLLQSQMEALRSLQPANPGQRLLNPAPENAPDVGVRINNQTTGSVSISAPANTSIGVEVRDSTVGNIQTVSGTGNTQVAGNRDTLRDGTARPDANGNVQTTNEPGLGIVLNHPGSSGNTGTNIRIDNSIVNGSVQSIIGNQNTQIDINEARINGDRRQTVTDGDNNRQTQNLGSNVTAGSVTQTIDGRSDSRQQIGNDVPTPASDVSVTGSVSSVQGNRNSVVQGNGNAVQIGEGSGVVVNGVRVDAPTPNAANNAQPVDARLSGGVQQSTVNGSVSAVQGNQNAVVEGNGNSVKIGDNDERKLEPVGGDDREIGASRRNNGLDGQSVPYTPRFSTQHDLTGEAGGRYTTISGHGVLETDRVIPQIGSSIQRDSFVVPEGVNLHFLGLPGGVITDRLGQRADVGGDLTGVPLLKLGAGDTAPDILITPAFGTINIQGNPITVDNPQGVRLSQLIRDHDLSGNIVVSTCLQQSVSQGNREHWQGITFDLPDQYPKPASPDLSSLPPRLPIDPNFHNQHGLNSTGDGKYTAIGGNAGLSGTNPNTGKPFAEQTFTVPEGVTVYFPSLPGGGVHNRLAEAIEKGEDLSRIPLLKAGAGTTAPDPLLLPGNYEVAGNFVRISDRDGQRLSEVIKEHGLTGNVVVAGGLEGRGKPHSNVLFDVPEQYQQRSVTGGTRGFDLNPEQVVAPRQQTPPPDNRQSSQPAPPQPGDPTFVAYQQSTKAVEQLNASLNLPRSEATEKLVVAAATVAVQQNLRVDEVALNKPTPTQPGGTTAFVIERTGHPETDRVGTVAMQQAMQKPLEEGYRSLAAAVQPQTPAQNPQQTQVQEQEELRSARRFA